mmetsp:Transcript_18602/g.54498  ORF Transcript_18602/g.54498 Transcript_18602/m.54498 type:complete len:373 (+) Transcript_18602:2517-3635(+)
MLFDVLLHNRHVNIFLIRHLLLVGVDERAEEEPPVALGKHVLGADALGREVRVHELDQLAPQPRHVLVSHEAVLEDALRFVHPESRQYHWFRNVIRLGPQHSLKDAHEVAEVEHIVRFGRRRQEVRHGRAVEINGRIDNGAAEVLELALKAIQEPRDDLAEDTSERLLSERHNRYHVEVPNKSRGDVVPPAARRAHGCHKLDVLDVLEDVRLGIVPAAVVHPLAEELDGRLRAVGLLLRHVQVVHENRASNAMRRPEDELSPLVELALDDVLHLRGESASGEGEEERRPLVGVELVQLKFHRHGLSCACRPDDESGPATLQKGAHSARDADRVHGGHRDRVHLRVLLDDVLGDRLHPRDPLGPVRVEHDVVQ